MRCGPAASGADRPAWAGPPAPASRPAGTSAAGARRRCRAAGDVCAWGRSSARSGKARHGLADALLEALELRGRRDVHVVVGVVVDAGAAAGEPAHVARDDLARRVTH